MKLYRRFSFWLPILSIFICFFNLLGFDDKNLLLFITSPPFWLTETHWFVVNFMHPSEIPLGIIYVLAILFWFLIGMILDKIIKIFLNKGNARH
ncbi:hypothetical protein BTR25_25935 [Bacillus sp. MRMR6]|nr:hypothetical protein BTR25_25935 [Bacillus sp. MRMR6]